MAQKITVTLEDDLDGGPADQTVRFGLDGAEYEIDLSTSNATAFVRSWPHTPHAPARPFGPRSELSVLTSRVVYAGGPQA